VRLSDVKRLGYLLDAVGEGDLAAPLAEWLKTQHRRVVPLLPGEPAQGKIDERWHVQSNAELELEL